MKTTSKEISENQPKCREGQETCPERKIWLELYADFAKRRKVCRYFYYLLYNYLYRIILTKNLQCYYYFIYRRFVD